MRRRLYFVFCAVFCGVIAYAQQSKPLQFREETFDFGSVLEDNGPVLHEFVFTNNSARPVKILSVQASCGCTTPDWSKDIVAPGKTGFIKASYNPKGRPGYFNKSLTVTTDIDASPIILQIKGQVSSEAVKPAGTEFASANGNWKLKTSSFNMGRVYTKDEFVMKEFQFVNGGTKAITYLDSFTGPRYIKVDVQPKTVAPGELGKVKLSYNGKQKNQYGFQSDNVEIQTDDELNPAKSFSIYATLEDFFPPLSAEELAKAPVMKFSSYAVEFGRIKKQTATTKEVRFTNAGKKDLILKSIQGNCTCITVTADKSTLKSGESSSLKISFNPQERTGTQQKAVTIYSNDPQNPIQRVTFTAYVED